MRIIHIMALAAVCALPAGCGGGDDTPPHLLRAVSDACQKIDRRPAAECDCRAGVLAANLKPEAFEAFAFYRGHWAGDVLYEGAEMQARKATVEQFKLHPTDLDVVVEAETTYAEKLKACDGKT